MARKSDSKFSIFDLFGLSEKRGDEIMKAWRHAKIDAEKWTELWEFTVKNGKVKGEAEFAYLGYIFGRLYEEMEGQDHEEHIERMATLMGVVKPGGKGFVKSEGDIPDEVKKVIIDHLLGKHDHDKDGKN